MSHTAANEGRGLPTVTVGRSARLAVAGTIVVVASTPLAAWWLIGDQGEGRYADYYMVRPPRLDAATQIAIGVASLVVALVGLGLVLAAEPMRGRRLSRWQATLGLILLAEIIIAWCYRVFTAATIGANIGGGMALVMGFALVGFVLLAAWERIRGPRGWSPRWWGVAIMVFGTFLLSGVSLWLPLVLVGVAVVGASTKLCRLLARGSA